MDHSGAAMELAAQPQDSSSNGGLGGFGKFPAEIRTEIFKYLLPKNFRQVYNIHKSTFILRRAGSSPHPACFRLSKQLRNEVLAASNVDREHNITIHLHHLETNFIGTQALSSNTSAPKSLVGREITACNMLNVTITRPTPRTATGFAQLRSHVHDLVDLLNTAPAEILPKLTVRLEFSQAVDSGFCAYNDFSLLMGPFYRLGKRCRASMMYTTTGSLIFTPAIEEQCHLLEESLKGGAMARYNLRYQQCNLEIKLAMLLQSNLYEESTLASNELEWLKQKSNHRVAGACMGLTAWHGDKQKWYGDKQNGPVPPPFPRWLPEIHQLAAKGLLSTTSAQLRDEICERMDLLRYWVTGHNKAFNPIWSTQSAGGGSTADPQGIE